MEKLITNVQMMNLQTHMNSEDQKNCKDISKISLLF